MDRPPLAPELVEALRALAEPQRLALLAALLEGPRAVGDLVSSSGLAQASVSHHLAVLRRAGLVVSVRDGRRQLYGWIDDATAGAPAAVDAGFANLLTWLRHEMRGPTTGHAAGGRVASGIAGAGNRDRVDAYPSPTTVPLEDHLL